MMMAYWNQGFDFADPLETGSPIVGTVPATSSLSTGTSIAPPLNLIPGLYRIRIALREGRTATECGTYTAEVEDYVLNITANAAPALSTSAVPS